MAGIRSKCIGCGKTTTGSRGCCRSCRSEVRIGVKFAKDAKVTISQLFNGLWVANNRDGDSLIYPRDSWEQAMIGLARID